MILVPIATVIRDRDGSCKVDEGFVMRVLFVVACLLSSPVLADCPAGTVTQPGMAVDCSSPKKVELLPGPGITLAKPMGTLPTPTIPVNCIEFRRTEKGTKAFRKPDCPK